MTTTSKYLKIDSSDRLTGSSHNFHINIPQYLRSQRLKLAYLSMPISWYNINENNNRIYLDEGTIVQGTIPIGNYTSDALVSAVETELNNITGSGRYNVSLDRLTNKLTVSALSNFKVPFGTNSVNNVLGFDTTQFERYGTSFTASGMVNVNMIDSLHVSIGKSIQVESTDHQGCSLVIPVNKNQLDFIDYAPQEEFRQCITLQTRRNNINVVVRDGKHNILDLNGLDWYMVLEILD